MNTFNIKRSVVISFFVVFGTATFKAKIISPQLPVMILSKRVATAAVPVAKEIIGRIEVRVSRKQTALKDSQFLESKNLALCKLGTEQLNWQAF